MYNLINTNGMNEKTKQFSDDFILTPVKEEGAYDNCKGSNTSAFNCVAAQRLHYPSVHACLRRRTYTENFLVATAK